MSELSDSVRGSWSFCRDVVSRCRMLLWSSTMTHNRGMKPKCCVQSPFSLPTSVGLDRYLADSLVPAGFYISSLRLHKSCNLAEWVTSSTEDVSVHSPQTNVILFFSFTCSSVFYLFWCWRAQQQKKMDKVWQTLRRSHFLTFIIVDAVWKTTSNPDMWVCARFLTTNVIYESWWRRGRPLDSQEWV